MLKRCVFTMVRNSMLAGAAALGRIVNLPPSDIRLPDGSETTRPPSELPPPVPRPAVALTIEEGDLALLEPTDLPAFEAHLFRLSNEERRLRFAHPAPDRFVQNYVRGIDWDRSFLLAWQQEGAPRAVAHVAWPDVSWLAGAGDVALSVEGPWQHQGVGTALLGEAISEAERRSLAALQWSALAENEGVRRLMRRFGSKFRRTGTVMEGRFNLADVPPGLRRSTRLRRPPTGDRLTAAVERLDLTPKVPRIPE